MPQRLTPRRAASVLTTCAAFAWLVGVAWTVRSQASGRLTDFAVFYAGGRLAGTGQLYNAEQLQRIEMESAGRRSPAHGFIRPPFHALLFWPLAQLPYESAEVAWATLSGLALAGFAFLWPTLDLDQRSVLACISLPAAIGLANGQDSALLLLAVTGGAALHREDRRFAAGILLSLCAAKAHLFLFVPLLVLRLRDYRFGSGLLAGGMLLGVVSTVVEGPQWPVRMWNAATDPAFTPEPGLMPNIAGALNGIPAAGWIYAAAGVALSAILWRSLPGAPFHMGVAGAIAASLPLAPHSYLPDCVLLLPAVCEAIQHKDSRVRFAGYLLATPLPFVAVFVDWPYSSFTALAVLLFAAFFTRSISAAK